MILSIKTINNIRAIKICQYNDTEYQFYNLTKQLTP